jgi:biopolymer transport protein ExbD
MAISLPSQDDYNTTINVVPLVDIMLVLLIIFIITLPVMTHAVIIDLPRPEPTDVPPEVPVAISIDVQFDGSIQWNGSPVSLTDMRSYIAAEAQKADQPEVHISVDRRAKYETAALVLFEVQRGGLKKIGFVTGAGGNL